MGTPPDSSRTKSCSRRRATGRSTSASTASCARSLTDVRFVGEAELLDGEDVVPGFGCPLKDVLG
jgi:hypothetical protein